MNDDKVMRDLARVRIYVDDDEVNPTIVACDGPAICYVSAEDGTNFADYYGEFRDGYPWINPKLEEFAASRGLVWEWIDPGTIGLFR